MNKELEEDFEINCEECGSVHLFSELCKNTTPTESWEDPVEIYDDSED